LSTAYWLHNTGHTSRFAAAATTKHLLEGENKGFSESRLEGGPTEKRNGGSTRMDSGLAHLRLQSMVETAEAATRGGSDAAAVESSGAGTDPRSSSSSEHPREGDGLKVVAAAVTEEVAAATEGGGGDVG
jgi:hypothetical protein